MGMRFNYLEAKDGLIHVESSGVNIDTTLLRLVGATMAADGEEGIVVIEKQNVTEVLYRLKEVLNAHQFGIDYLLGDFDYNIHQAQALMDIPKDKVNQHVAGLSLAALLDKDFVAV